MEKELSKKKLEIDHWGGIKFHEWNFIMLIHEFTDIIRRSFFSAGEYKHSYVIVFLFLSKITSIDTRLIFFIHRNTNWKIFLCNFNEAEFEIFNDEIASRCCVRVHVLAVIFRPNFTPLYEIFNITFLSTRCLNNTARIYYFKEPLTLRSVRHVTE